MGEFLGILEPQHRRRCLTPCVLLKPRRCPHKPETNIVAAGPAGHDGGRVENHGDPQHVPEIEIGFQRLRQSSASFLQVAGMKSADADHPARERHTKRVPDCFKPRVGLPGQRP